MQRPGKKSVFGHRIIGKEAAERASEQRKPKSKFGPRVVGSKVTPGTNTPALGSMRVPAGLLAIGSLRELLNGNPAYLKSYMEKELARKPYPRLAAIEVFLEIATKFKDHVAVSGSLYTIEQLRETLQISVSREQREQSQALDELDEAHAADPPAPPAPVVVTPIPAPELSADEQRKRAEHVERIRAGKEKARIEREAREAAAAQRRQVARQRQLERQASVPTMDKPDAGDPEEQVIRSDSESEVTEPAAYENEE